MPENVNLSDVQNALIALNSELRQRFLHQINLHIQLSQILQSIAQRQYCFFDSRFQIYTACVDQTFYLQNILRIAFLYCMNKYLMRKLESNPLWFDWVDPRKETDDQIIAKIKEWPFMLKNTSLSLGRGIFRIKSPDQLRQVQKLLN